MKTAYLLGLAFGSPFCALLFITATIKHRCQVEEKSHKKEDFTNLCTFSQQLQPQSHLFTKDKHVSKFISLTMLRKRFPISRKRKYPMASRYAYLHCLWWQECPYLCLSYMNYYRLCFCRCRNLSIAYLHWDQMRAYGPPLDLFEGEGWSGGVFMGPYNTWNANLCVLCGVKGYD
jgi:hypothetical protein